MESVRFATVPSEATQAVDESAGSLSDHGTAPELSRGHIFAGPLMWLALLFTVSLALTAYSGVVFRYLIYPYFSASAAITLLCVLGTIFWWVLELAWRRADQPLHTIAVRMKPRLIYLTLPVLVFPMFLVSYTAAKTCIPFIVGYPWEGFWANADSFIFGDDVWHIAHRWLGERPMPYLEWIYTVAWGGALVISSALSVLVFPIRRIGVFYTAMMGTWVIGGVLLAYLLSAAGPVFAHIGDPSLAARFSPLTIALHEGLSPHGAIRFTQDYLATRVDSHIAVKGGGISAMPSMHLGTATVYVLAARGTVWLFPTIAFWLLIFVCSGYFGYHYWIDGILAAGVAIVCWAVSERFYCDNRWANDAGVQS
jgi:hypothetical protein